MTYKYPDVTRNCDTMITHELPDDEIRDSLMDISSSDVAVCHLMVHRQKEALFGATSSARMRRHFRRPSYQNITWFWLLISIFFHQIVPSSTSGYMVVKFIRYENPTRLLASGDCCDEERKDVCLSNMKCDHIFDVCLSDPKVQTKCSLGTGFLAGPRQEAVFDFPGFKDRVMKEFQKWPGTTNVKITVKEWDDGNKDKEGSLVDTFTYTFTDTKLTQETSAPSAVQELEGSRAKSKTKLKIKVWAYCNQNWYGSHCDRTCIASDSCTSGHYTCNALGQKVCNKGWSGTDCKTRVAGAECSTYTGLPESVWETSFKCAETPYTLTLKLTSPPNVQFSGTVDVKTGSATGTYKFTGDQKKLDAISIKNGDWVTKPPANVQSFQLLVALSNDGMSLVGKATSTGVCTTSDVTLKRTNVTPPGCKWATECWKFGDYYGQFACCCKPGYSGRRCEIPPDRCTPNPCKNNGKCSNLPDNSDFKCKCTEGFFEKTCSKTPKDIPCTPNPCQHDGTCYTDGAAGSKCRCPTCWKGHYCETVDRAVADSCSEGHYKCDSTGKKICNVGWKGTACKTRDPEKAKCSVYKGLPESTWEASFTCAGSQYTMTLKLTSVESTKFSGTTEVKIGTSAGMYKVTGEQTNFKAIAIKDGDWLTKQPANIKSFQFEGELSEDGTSLAGEAVSTACSVQVTLKRTNVRKIECKWGKDCWRFGETYEKFSCCCNPGYKGPRCDIPPNHCTPNPCKNDGKCSNLKDHSDFKCECKKEFHGKTCSTTPKDIPCDPNPCKNGGTCFWFTKTGSKCRCTDLHEGTYCEIKSDKKHPPCPTHRYGPDCEIVCKATDSCEGHYKCSDKGERTCNSGWIGAKCDQHKTFDEAVRKKHCPEGKTCQNKGVCLNKACCCPKGFKGTLCEIQINECDNKPCKNGATCTDKVPGYECKCKDGYEGDNCERVTDYCLKNPCKNEGVCELLAPGRGYRCRCKSRFFGKQCEHAGKDITCSPCKNKGTCTYDATYGFRCKCPKGAVGERCESIAPGPPRAFDKSTRTDKSLTLSWAPPSYEEYGHVQEYEVTCAPEKSSNKAVLDDKKKYTKTELLGWRNKTYTMDDLQPGTTYKCSIRASTAAGYGVVYTKTIVTKPGKPNFSEKPKLDLSKSTATTFHVSIPPISITTGPISAFRFVVQMVSSGRLQKRSLTETAYSDDVLHRYERDAFFSDDLHRERRAISGDLSQEKIKTLTGYESAKKNNLTHYIAAEYTHPYRTFVIGDNEKYGKYRNAPLTEGKLYNIYFGVISNLDGETAAVYTRLGDEPVRAEKVSGGINWRIGLAVGVVLVVLATIFIIVMIFVFRSRRRKGQLNRDNCKQPVHVTSRDSVQNGVTNPAFDHEHQLKHNPVGQASDAYTLQRKLSSNPRRQSDAYEINYNDSQSQYGKFDNKGFVAA